MPRVHLVRHVELASTYISVEFLPLLVKDLTMFLLHLVLFMKIGLVSFLPAVYLIFDASLYLHLLLNFVFLFSLVFGMIRGLRMVHCLLFLSMSFLLLLVMSSLIAIFELPMFLGTAPALEPQLTLMESMVVVHTKLLESTVFLTPRTTTEPTA